MPVKRMLPRLELNQNSSRPQIQQILGTRAEDQGCSGLELTEVETGVIREVEETVSSKEGEPDMDVELASDNKQFQGNILKVKQRTRNTWCLPVNKSATMIQRDYGIRSVYLYGRQDKFSQYRGWIKTRHKFVELSWSRLDVLWQWAIPASGDEDTEVTIRVSQVLHQGCGSLGYDQREQTLLSRDSSHGSNSLDTETRALLDKLECVLQVGGGEDTGSPPHLAAKPLASSQKIQEDWSKDLNLFTWARIIFCSSYSLDKDWLTYFVRQSLLSWRYFSQFQINSMNCSSFLRMLKMCFK